MRSVQVKEVRVAGNRGSVESVCAIFPFVAELSSVDCLEFHGRHASCHDVETCG